MKLIHKIPGITVIVFAAACASDAATANSNGAASLRVVNAFTSSVDVFVDGTVAITGLPAGTIGTAAPASGNHTIEFRSATGASSTQSVTTSSGGMNTIAVTRASSGGVASAVLDDTNSVVAANATRVRVLHMAPSAGTLQVYRTQPDYQAPISWQFPFTYQATFNSLSAPFYQSTVGTWEIHIWQAPADGSGWASAPVKITIPLGSGEKKTVVILDAPGGGVRAELF